MLMGVVIRHLPNSRPVTSTVLIAEVFYYDEAYKDLNEQALDHIKDLRTIHVEFAAAEFYLDVMEEGKLVHSITYPRKN